MEFGTRKKKKGNKLSGTKPRKCASKEMESTKIN